MGLDLKQLLLWLVPIIVRGLAWVLAAKLGYDAAEAQGLATQIGNGIGAAVLVIVAIVTSLVGRKQIQVAATTKALSLKKK